jgi:type IV secretory pathway VirB2 component (pilin)
MKLSARSIQILAVATPLFIVGSMAAASATAVAGTTAVLPWETALGTLSQSLSGNTAKIICTIAVFIAGVALIFGEDLGAFAKRLLMIVIATAFIIGAASFVGVFGQAAGAVL